MAHLGVGPVISLAPLLGDYSRTQSLEPLPFGGCQISLVLRRKQNEH
jgi:hypothetical protein